MVALAEMLEFYDSALKLNLSFNRDVTNRGWTSLFRALKSCTSLQVLNLRYASVDRALPNLCRFLRNHLPSSLVCVHLENVGLSGRNLSQVANAFKQNITIKVGSLLISNVRVYTLGTVSWGKQHATDRCCESSTSSGVQHQHTNVRFEEKPAGSKLLFVVLQLTL